MVSRATAWRRINPDRAAEHARRGELARRAYKEANRERIAAAERAKRLRDRRIAFLQVLEAIIGKKRGEKSWYWRNRDKILQRYRDQCSRGESWAQKNRDKVAGYMKRHAATPAGRATIRACASAYYRRNREAILAKQSERVRALSARGEAWWQKNPKRAVDNKRRSLAARSPEKRAQHAAARRKKRRERAALAPPKPPRDRAVRKVGSSDPMRGWRARYTKEFLILQNATKTYFDRHELGLDPVPCTRYTTVDGNVHEFVGDHIGMHAKQLRKNCCDDN